MWEQESFKDSLRWYKQKSVSRLDAMHKKIEFYQHKGVHKLKLGCNLPRLANICLHSSTSEDFYPFTKSDKCLLLKVPENKIGVASILLTRITCWWNSHPQVYKHLLIDCWKRCQPILTLLNVSANAFMTLQKTWVWCRFAIIQAPPEQIYKFRKRGFVVLSTIDSGLKIWGLLHNRVSENHWLFQCRWVLWTLQQCLKQ